MKPKTVNQRVSDINQQARDITDYLCSRGDKMPMRGQIEAQARQMLHALQACGWKVDRPHRQKENDK